MVDAFKNNFLVFPALAIAALLYFVLPAREQKGAFFLFDSHEARLVECRLLSAPVKVGTKKKSYMAKASVLSASGKRGFASSASGEAVFFLPLELCEIYQPGKLYSAWRGQKVDFLLDKGGRVVFEVEEGSSGVFFNVRSIVSCGYESSFWGSVQKFRALCRLHFTRLMYAWGGAGGLLLALLTGSRAYLEEESAAAFRLAGLSHILALSGMHLSLFGSLAFAIGKKSFGKKTAPFFELFAALAFVWFAGRSPSLFRALLCSAAAISFGLLRIPIKSALNLLALAFIVHVSIFPEEMLELSFMLSYGALAGILAFNEFVSKPLLAALPSGAGKPLGQSIGAQAMTFPICARFFGSVAPGAIVSSAIVAPLVLLFVYAGLAAIILSLLFPSFAPFCGGLLKAFYAAIKGAVLFFARIPCLKI